MSLRRADGWALLKQIHFRCLDPHSISHRGDKAYTAEMQNG
jgi:hypothetical protein